MKIARIAVVLSLAGVCAVVSACTTPTEIGPCDPDLARRVVYDDTGAPAYEGQALVVTSCGGGGLCHSAVEDVDGADSERFVARHGAPAGLDYDLNLAENPEDLARLEADQLRVVSHRTWIWEQVRTGQMPPAAEGMQAMGVPYSRYDAVTDALTPMPGLDSEEGQEILRNWLSCRAPVVERSTPREDEAHSVGAVVSGRELEPIPEGWPALYAQVVAPRCATSNCHGEDEAGGLDLQDMDGSLTALVGTSATERGDCDGEGLRVVAGSPGTSLLMHKLTGRDETGAPVCGAPMPDSGGRAPQVWIDAFDAWILSLPEE